MKNFLLATALLCAFFAQAQSKTTGVVTIGGTSDMTATVLLNSTTTTATLTITGPSDRWFALQIGSFDNGAGMQTGQDMVYYNGTTIVDGSMNGVGVTPATDATNNWTMTSNTTSGTTRTVVATRAFTTNDSKDYTFVYSDTTIDFAWAKSPSASYTLGNHGSNRGYSLNNALTEQSLGTDNFALNNLKVYPNPATQILNISNQSQLQNVTITNIVGQVVLYKNVNEDNVKLDIANLSTGMHILKATDINGNAKTIKLMVKN